MNTLFCTIGKADEGYESMVYWSGDNHSQSSTTMQPTFYLLVLNLHHHRMVHHVAASPASERFEASTDRGFPPESIEASRYSYPVPLLLPWSDLDGAAD
mmetsp:Transcript_12449/g.20132  ORF Transcript_12449/g.20132 Transcript_12449/m.20132 type:complete len:99 (-) Transcript_12449:1267-1563(-)